MLTPVSYTHLDVYKRQLYEITEGLFRLFADDFPENEQVFVQAFLDMVSEYTQKESADLKIGRAHV